MNWSTEYCQIISRNLGIISRTEQDKLSKACVCICGLGGLGGVVAEVLARAGVLKFKLLDRDVFEKSNINRQIGATYVTLGQRKTEVTKTLLKNINPEIEIEIYNYVDESNIQNLVKGSDVIIMALDGIEGYIRIDREARKQNIPLVEGWAIPFLNVRVIDDTTPSIEDLYGLPTKNKNLSEFSESDFKKMHIEVLMTLTQIKGLLNFYSKESLLKMLSGEGVPSSFAPMVWNTSLMMAVECIKIITGMGKIKKAPKWALYDPWNHKIPWQLAFYGRASNMWKTLVKMYFKLLIRTEEGR